MDFLGRQSKRRYQAAIDLLLASDKTNEALMRGMIELQTQLDAKTAHAEELKQINTSLIRKLTELSVVSQPQQAMLVPETPRPRQPNPYMSEDEAELRWRHDNKLIDTQTYTDLLRNLDFENAEIELAPEYGGPGERFSY